MIWMQDEIVHSTVAKKNKGRDWNRYEIELLWGLTPEGQLGWILRKRPFSLRKRPFSLRSRQESTGSHQLILGEGFRGSTASSSLG